MFVDNSLYVVMSAYNGEKNIEKPLKYGIQS